MNARRLLICFGLFCIVAGLLFAVVMPGVAQAAQTCQAIAQLVAKPGFNRNIRQGPGTGFAIVATLVPGSAPVDAVSLDNGWYQLCNNWFVGAVAVNTTTPTPRTLATSTPTATPTRVTSGPTNGMWVRIGGTSNWIDFDKDCGNQGPRIICFFILDIFPTTTPTPMSSSAPTSTPRPATPTNLP